MSKARYTAIEHIAKELSKSTDKMAEYFDYLDQLKKDGKDKMFGGIKYLMEYDKKLSRREASEIYVEWMKSYED